VAIEATYNITGTLRPLIGSSTGGVQQAGIRIVFPLAPRSAGVTIVNTAQQLRAAVANGDPLVYWIARTDASPDPILVSVGADEPLAQLRLDGKTDIAPLVPPERTTVAVPIDAEDQLTSPLGGPDTDIERLVVWLEPPDGPRYPLVIRAIGHVASARDAKSFFSNVFLALLRRPDGTYRAIAVLPDEDSFGPPNLPDVERCNTLVGDDFWTQLMRQWYGCS
jgi:hypothetical protein